LDSEPLVSFGLPIYNGADYLEKCLLSLIEQTHSNIEVLINDDCSLDNSYQICEGLIKGDPRFVLRKNKKRLGAHDNFLVTLQRATGEFFVWASQDDWWNPNFTSTLLARLKQNVCAVVAMSATDTFGIDGNSRGRISLVGHNYSLVDNSPRQRARAILSKGKVGNLGPKANLFIHGMVRRSVFVESIKAFPGRFGNERNLLVQWALAGDFEYVASSLFYRTTYDDVTRRIGDPNANRLSSGSTKKQVFRKTIPILVSILRSPLISTKARFIGIVVVLEWFVLYGPFPIKLALALRQMLPASVYAGLKKLYNRNN
jgi:glycosyltransferase involved in cell wall biosynthesis